MTTPKRTHSSKLELDRENYSLLNVQATWFDSTTKDINLKVEEKSLGYWHINPCGIILCLGVKLYVYIYNIVKFLKILPTIIR